MPAGSRRREKPAIDRCIIYCAASACSIDARVARRAQLARKNRRRTTKKGREDGRRKTWAIDMPTNGGGNELISRIRKRPGLVNNRDRSNYSPRRIRFIEDRRLLGISSREISRIDAGWSNRDSASSFRPAGAGWTNGRSDGNFAQDITRI